MVWQYASRSLADARESFESGNNRSAAELLQQSKGDVVDSPFDFGEIGAEYVERCDDFNEEVKNSARTDENKLGRILTRLDKLMNKLKEERAGQDPEYDYKE